MSGLGVALEARRAARTRAEAALAQALRAHTRAERAVLEARAALEASLKDGHEPPRAPELGAASVTGAALAREASRARMHGEHRARLRAAVHAADQALLERGFEVQRASAVLAQALGHERALERAVDDRAGAELRLRERREQAGSDEASASRQRSPRPR